jgi:enoyl-CoA hydratase/carnithine racemase
MRAGKGLCAGIDLDAWNDALTRESFGERCAARSSYMMTPLMNSAMPAEVKSISR